MSATYVGQIGRSLAQQLKEYKSALTNAHPERSAIAEHAVNTGHTIDWSNTKIKVLWAEVCLGDLAYDREASSTYSTERKVSYLMYDTLIRDDISHMNGGSMAQS